MAPTNLNFDTDVLPVVRVYAMACFTRDRDRPTKVADSVSLAWEDFQRANDRATPKSIAWFAVRRAAAGRQFQQSESSIDGPNPRHLEKPERSGFDVGQLSRQGDDPADLAALLVDVPEWFSDVLTERQVEICEALWSGDSPSEIAERFGISRSRVTQLRRWLVESWLAFTA